MQATLTHTTRPTSRTNILPSIGLWILQVLLAVVFLAHGILLLAPPAEMLAMINSQMGVGLRLLIGVAEVLGAVGLIGPGATRILPKLTQLAAAGLMIIMGGASVFHALVTVRPIMIHGRHPRCASHRRPYSTSRCRPNTASPLLPPPGSAILSAVCAFCIAGRSYGRQEDRPDGYSRTTSSYSHDRK